MIGAAVVVGSDAGGWVVVKVWPLGVWCQQTPDYFVLSCSLLVMNRMYIPDLGV